jgi:hypothetical protein
MEGRCLGLPAVAVSLVTSEHRRAIRQRRARAVELLSRLGSHPLPADTILNLNVPDLPWERIRGWRVCRLGNRHRAEPCIRAHDPRGRPIWWIGAAGSAQDAGTGYRFPRGHEGWIALTPIHVDLTRYQALESLSSWAEGLQCAPGTPGMMVTRRPGKPEVQGTGMTSQRARDRLIERLRGEGGIRDERVLRAMQSLPRHLFIDEALASRAYEDTALPIGNGQTISQPWVVARMTEALIEHGMPKKVLEIGTGSATRARYSPRSAWRSTPSSASTSCCAWRAAASATWG